MRFIHDNFVDKLHIVAYSCFVPLLKLNLIVMLLCYIYSSHCCCFVEVVRFIHDNFVDKSHIVAYSCFVPLLKLNLIVMLLC